MTGCTSGGCDQFETSPEAIEQELRDLHFANVHRLKTNYSVDFLVQSWAFSLSSSIFFTCAISSIN